MCACDRDFNILVDVSGILLSNVGISHKVAVEIKKDLYMKIKVKHHSCTWDYFALFLLY